MDEVNLKYTLDNIKQDVANKTQSLQTKTISSMDDQARSKSHTIDKTETIESAAPIEKRTAV